MIDWTTVITAAIAAFTSVVLAAISAYVTYKIGYHNGKAYQAIAMADADRHLGKEMRASDTVPVHTAEVAGSGNPGAGGNVKETRQLGE